MTRLSRHRDPDPHLPLGYTTDAPFDHDPLDPHPEIPTPEEFVVRLTRSQRERRVERLVELAHRRYDEAITREVAGRDVAAVCSLVSGGNDSYTVEHLFRDRTTHHVHCNTGTGIEATREFVRATAAALGKPLIEHLPPEGQRYRDLVLGNVVAVARKTGEPEPSWPAGFPGPAAHKIMFQRLKQRQLNRIPHDFGISGSRTDRVVFIAGRRRAESTRRAAVPHYESVGTIVWVSPIAVWQKSDLRAYRLMHPDVPVNPVAQTLGMSGECGCLANATAGEPDRWRAAYPDDPFIREITELEGLLRNRTDVPEHRKKWGWGGMVDDPDTVEEMASDSLCSTNCGVDPVFDLMDPLFDLDNLDGTAA